MTATLPTPRPIRACEKVDRKRFLEELRPIGEPVVLRGLAEHWPAVAEARRSDEAMFAYLSRFATTEPVEMVVGPPEIEGRFSYTDNLEGLNFVRGRSPVGAFFDRLLRDRTQLRPYAMAMQSAVIPRLLPGFELQNFTDLSPWAVPPRIWIGTQSAWRRTPTPARILPSTLQVTAGSRSFRRRR
jgi:hypothetical protein